MGNPRTNPRRHRVVVLLGVRFLSLLSFFLHSDEKPDLPDSSEKKTRADRMKSKFYCISDFILVMTDSEQPQARGPGTRRHVVEAVRGSCVEPILRHVSSRYSPPTGRTDTFSRHS